MTGELAACRGGVWPPGPSNTRAAASRRLSTRVETVAVTLSHTHTGAACSAAVCGRSLKDANHRDGGPEEKSVLRIGVYGWRAECEGGCENPWGATARAF